MKKLLLVDENTAAQQVIQEALGDGYKLFHAATQTSVGICIENNKPQIILVNVASLGGKAAEIVETARKASPHGKNTRLVLMSGRKNDVSEFNKYRALDFLAIPMELDEFYERIEEAFVTACGLRDEVTGCYKRAFIESKIRDRLSLHRKGTMFMLNIDSYSFVSNSVGAADLQLCAYAMRKELGESVLLGINGYTIIGYIAGEERHDITMKKLDSLIAVIQQAMGERKVFTSIGVGNASEYDYNYNELYPDCDRALGVSRSRGKNCSSYYRRDKAE